MKYLRIKFPHFKKILILALFFSLFGIIPSVSAQSILQLSLTPSPTTDPCPNRDCKPTDTPTPSPTSAPAPTSPPATSAPAPTNTPNPTATPKPTLKPTVFIPVSNISPTEEPAESPTPTPDPSPTTTPTPTDAPVKRSAMVAAITSPDEIPVSSELLFLSLLSSGFLVLLIVFPAELFNSTVQGNYEEIMKWSLIHRIKLFYNKVNHLPALVIVIVFAISGAVINSFLSPDIGFNEGTYALVLGMLFALLVIVTIYDLVRIVYMKKRFGVSSRLRAHSLGLFTGTLLVVVSRLANFLPGYCYGIFTGLIYNREVNSKEEGEGLAISALLLLAIALGGWFTWIPIKDAATSGDPAFWVLIVDAFFASLWVSTLTATIFGLAPIRFLYGEQVKKWNFIGWIFIYFTGLYLFVYTLLNPAIGIYGKSDKVSWAAVLSLFFGFGLFSFLFWGYFRYRHLWGGGPRKG
jgi:hypothetical protein